MPQSRELAPFQEGIFLKIFVAWIILAVIFYVWSYVREGKFIGEDHFVETEEEKKEE